MIFARQINKILEFYMIIAIKIFSRFLGGGIGPLIPVAYAYGKGDTQDYISGVDFEKRSKFSMNFVHIK